MRKSRNTSQLNKLASAACLTALMAAAAATPAFAQIDEIIVTASKKSQTLQEAGVAITAVQAETLERMGAVNFADFAVRVPNLGFGNESDGRFNANSPALRGVSGANTTGFYIDDTPVPMSIQPRVIDVQRVEVLRGPQGSLYGARSMGGTIRLITKQPDLDGDVSGKVHATLSSVKEGGENWSVDGSVNIPLVEDKMAARITAYYGSNSGIFDREYLPTYTRADGTVEQNPGTDFGIIEDVDSEKYYGFQASVKAQITDNLTFTPKLMYQKIEADGLPFADVTPDNFTQARFFNIEEDGSDRWWLGSGTFDWNLSHGKVVSTTSYFDRYLNENEEETHFLHFLHEYVVGIPIAPLASVITENERFKSLVHETRYTSSNSGALNYTVGVFYQRTKNHLRYDPAALQVGLTEAYRAAVGDPTFDIAPGDLIYINDAKFNTKEYAVFGEFTYDVNDVFSVTAGGRWYSTSTDAIADADGFANDGPSHNEGEQSETGFNPKVLVQLEASDNIDLYASASKGFRIGGINGNIPAGSGGICEAEVNALGLDPSQTKTYDSDTLWSYEVGMKSKFADNRISLNLAGYQIDWSNISQQNRLACGFQYIANAGEAKIQGFEAELVFVPLDGLTITSGLGHADTEITDTGNAIGVQVGDLIQGVPNWTYSGAIEYVFPVSSEMDVLLRADVNHYGESESANNGRANPRLRPAWQEVNLRAGIIRGDWEIAVFVENLTNEHINLADSRSIAAETPGRQRLVTNRPRTIGVDLRTRF